MTTSNDVVLTLFHKDFSAGSSVTLGTNGAQGLSANYIVFVLPQGTYQSETHEYPKVTNIQYNTQYHQFKVNWSSVKGASQYGIAVKLAGRWKVQAYTDAYTTTFTSPKLKAGSSYQMVICAKVNGNWDITDINSRSFYVTVK